MPHQQTVQVAMITPTQGVYGGMEAAAINIAQLFNNTPVKIKILFKVVKDSSFSPNLQNACKAAKIQYTHFKSLNKIILQSVTSVDLIHCHNAPIPFAHLSKLLNKPLLLTIYHQGKTSNPIQKSLWQSGIKLADKRCYISNFVWEVWEKQKDANSYRIPAFSFQPPPLRIPREKKGFLFLSRWIQNKGIEVLIEAYQRANLDPTNWPLYMAGTGPLLEWAKEYIKKHKIPGIHLLGFIEEQAKFEYFNQAKWLVAPPHTKEDMGLTPLEARHFKTPSIVTNDGGLTEAAGPAALICEPNNVEQLAHLLEQASKMDAKEYLMRSELSYSSIQDYLKPLSLYENFYRKLTSKEIYPPSI